MKNLYSNKKGFSLAEMIIVISILTLLSTIGFISYYSYIPGARDANRTSQLISIHDGLLSYKTRSFLPSPDKSVEIKFKGNTIYYQGYLGRDILNAVEYSKEGTDPKGNFYFTYTITRNRKNFQLLAYLEEGKSLAFENIIPKVNAYEYKNLYPYLLGKRLGTLVETNTKTPIQEKLNGSIDLSTTNKYTAYFSNNNIARGAELYKMIPNLSCKRILEIGNSRGNGVYKINPMGEANSMEAYCDMKTEGGGWTMIYKGKTNFSLNGSSDGIPDWLNDGNYRLNNSYWNKIKTGKTLARIIKDNGEEEIIVNSWTPSKMYNKVKTISNVEKVGIFLK